MVQPSKQDREMLDGLHGKAAQLAMSVIVRMADVYGAEEMMDITQAHIDGVGLLSETGLEFSVKLLPSPLDRAASPRCPRPDLAARSSRACAE